MFIMVNNDSYDLPSPPDSFEFQVHSVAHGCVDMDYIRELRIRVWEERQNSPLLKLLNFFKSPE